MSDTDIPIFDPDEVEHRWQPGDDDVDWDDVDTPMPTIVDLNLDSVNWMLGGIGTLARRVAEYTRLEEQQLDRLKARRQLIVGPWQRRIDELETAVKDFAVKAWRAEKRGQFALPNGTVKSSPVKDVIGSDPPVAATWLMKHAVDGETPVVYEPKVMVGDTRKLLERLESEGVIQRFIDEDGHDATMIDAGARWTEQLKPGQTGRWMIVENGDVVPGLTWTPNGDDGVGRNFKVVAA